MPFVYVLYVLVPPFCLSPYFFVQVECPDDLYDALVTAWDNHPQYEDVCDIIVDADDEDGEEEEGEGEGEGDDHQDATLLHTFYR